MLVAGTGRDSPGQGSVAEGKAVLLCPQAVCPLILLSSKAAPAFLLPASRTGCALCSVLPGRWSRGGWRGAVWHQLDASTAQPLLPASSPR